MNVDGKFYTRSDAGPCHIHVAPSGAQVDFPTVCGAEQILFVERSSPSFGSYSYYVIASQENISSEGIFSCCSLRSWRGHAGGMFTSAMWDLPAASSVTVNWLSLSLSQGISAAQHRPLCLFRLCYVDE